jgi:hypothetical protein
MTEAPKLHRSTETLLIVIVVLLLLGGEAGVTLGGAVSKEPFWFRRPEFARFATD